MKTKFATIILALCASLSCEAQTPLAGTYLRLVPQSSAPPILNRVGNVGLWTPNNGANTNLPEWRSSGGSDLGLMGTTAFATLPSASNGAIVYCSDCAPSNPCTGGGSGVFATMTGGSWVCNGGGPVNPSVLPVLNFPGGVNTTEVNCGHYWTTGSNLTQGLYEYWYRPNDGCNAEYVVSDGFGGAHALLIGCSQNGGAGTLITVTGDTSDNTLTGWSFGSDDGCWPGQWCHVLWYYDNAGNQYVYVQGVLSGGPTPGPAVNTRQSPATGGGSFLVGGSTHSNASFAISSMRGVEGLAYTTLPLRAFAPQTVLTLNYWNNSTTWTPASILLDFTQQGLIIADLSRGYNGGTHACSLANASVGIDQGFPFNTIQPWPKPQWVFDTNAPVTLGAAPPVQCLNPSTPPSPGRANPKIFDSFTRSGCDSTYAFDNTPSLGSTESGGSLGVLPWACSRPGNSGAISKWGYLNGRAVNLVLNGDFGGQICSVSSGSYTNVQDVQVDRFQGAWNSGGTGLAFQVTDKDNFNFCFTAGTPADPAIRCGAAVAGVLTVLTGQVDFTNFATAGSWITMRVTADGANPETINVYTCATNTCSSPSLVGTVAGNTANRTGAGVGIFNTAYNTTNIDSSFRWDNFGAY